MDKRSSLAHWEPTLSSLQIVQHYVGVQMWKQSKPASPEQCCEWKSRSTTGNKELIEPRWARRALTRIPLGTASAVRPGAGLLLAPVLLASTLLPATPLLLLLIPVVAIPGVVVCLICPRNLLSILSFQHLSPSPHRPSGSLPASPPHEAAGVIRHVAKALTRHSPAGPDPEAAT